MAPSGRGSQVFGVEGFLHSMRLSYFSLLQQVLVHDVHAVMLAEGKLPVSLPHTSKPCERRNHGKTTDTVSIYCPQRPQSTSQRGWILPVFPIWTNPLKSLHIPQPLGRTGSASLPPLFSLPHESTIFRFLRWYH